MESIKRRSKWYENELRVVECKVPTVIVTNSNAS